MAWRCVPIMLSIGKLVEDDYGVEANLGYMTTSRPVCVTQKNLVSKQTNRTQKLGI